MPPPGTPAPDMAPARGAPLVQRCPRCGGPLEFRGYRVPGARTLCEARCRDCAADLLADTDSGYGLFGDLIYDRGTDEIHGTTRFAFWKSWAETLFRTVHTGTIAVDIRIDRPITRPVLLNCLDPLFGHGLLALLNADGFGDRDLVAILPERLAWLLPPGLAGAIVVDWAAADPHAWNTSLDAAINGFLADHPDAQIAPALPIPRTERIDIARFTGIAPFDRDTWPGAGTMARICYVWRDDRLWGETPEAQAENVARLRHALAARLPDLQFVVTGLGAVPPALDPDLETVFVAHPDPAAERRMATLLAGAQVAVGVHGSNMILPSALAGATVELVPRGRWHNAWTASYFRAEPTPAQTVFFHRFLPVATPPGDVADVVQSIVGFAPNLRPLLFPVPPDAPGPAPGASTVLDPPPGPIDTLGILVLGYNRPHHLQSVLESLRLQGRLDHVHVWIDGTQGRGEYAGAPDATVAVAKRYAVRQRRLHRSHLGIEKMMLDALAHMSARYTRVLVLEDDCFVVESAVAQIDRTLQDAADDPHVFSVYGHPFGTEPPESCDFSRFQGWGWAAHSDRIRAILPDLGALFALDEDSYVAHIAARMTDAVAARLDVTPGRDVLNVLAAFFSWDSATAFLTAERGMVHRRTDTACILNTGIHPGIGHFRHDTPRLRNPPFNMITLDEAWAQYDRTTQPCDAGRDSYGLDALDLRLMEALPRSDPGFLIEIGAHDGVTQSNSVLLEAAGWHGLLIEATPGAYAKCVRARPGMIVEHAACVAADRSVDHLRITDVGLMSMGAHSAMTADQRDTWLARGEGFAGRSRQEIDVPTSTISRLLDKHAIRAVDLLILDVEGAELDVLGGIDFDRHAPRRILAEDAYDDTIQAFLSTRGYTRSQVLLERKFTRDCLYVHRSAVDRSLR